MPRGPKRVIKAAADVSPIDAFGGKATREHRIRVRSQQSAPCPTRGAAKPTKLPRPKVSEHRHLRCRWALRRAGGASDRRGPGTARRLMVLAKLPHAPLADQRDILRRKERENEAIVQRSKTATRRSRNKAERRSRGVRAALAAVNAEIAGKLNSAIENYNLVVSVVEAFRDEIVSEMEHYASDRSDRWQKSERGHRHEAWKQKWEGLDVTALDAIDAIDEPEMAHANELESIQSQPE